MPLIFSSSAMEAPEVPAPPLPEMTEENGSAAVVPEAPVGPDPASFSMQPAAVEEEGELPADFERLWKAAHDNPQDFTSWTDLLQYCEQEVCLFLWLITDTFVFRRSQEIFGEEI